MKTQIELDSSFHFPFHKYKKVLVVDGLDNQFEYLLKIKNRKGESSSQEYLKIQQLYRLKSSIYFILKVEK